MREENEYRTGCNRWLLALVLLLGAALVGVYVAVPSSALVATLADPERLRPLIRSWGAWGALALVTLQVLQVLLAPIPGQALGLVGGYLYGPWLGTLLNMTGTLIGAGLAMWLARRFGRPLAERLVSPQRLERLDDLARRRGVGFFFLVFLFPFLPDDAACFVAGLSPLPLGELLLIVLIGRLPGVFIPNWLGAHAAELSPIQWLVIALLMIPLAAAFWHWQASIERFLLRLLEKLGGRGDTERG
jgi:uncharacterized membrane protein YdjX (TVP38/TMEM64 family)